jgi:sec-independent protein translocase protein TatB
MFDISWGELLLIGVVALVFIGPKELPTVLRTLGQWMAKLRRMANEFQNQFHEAMREAEMADLKKHVDDLTTTAHSYANFDPVSEVRRELESTQQQITNAIEKPAEPAEGAAASAAVAPASDAPSDAPATPPPPEAPPLPAAPPPVAEPPAAGEPALAGADPNHDGHKHDGKPA